MLKSHAGKLAVGCATLVAILAIAADGYAQQPDGLDYPAGYFGGFVAPRPAYYNPVGFGFGGYSYGGYPAYGYNAYLPSVYAGFNTPGVAGPAPGGYVYYPASDAWGATCGPTGCRLGYRGW